MHARSHITVHTRIDITVDIHVHTPALYVDARARGRMPQRGPVRWCAGTHGRAHNRGEWAGGIGSARARGVREVGAEWRAGGCRRRGRHRGDENGGVTLVLTIAGVARVST